MEEEMEKECMLLMVWFIEDFLKTMYYMDKEKKKEITIILLDNMNMEPKR